MSAMPVSRFAVYAAKGEKFSISYDGQVRVYRVDPIPSGGISVQKRDHIQTKDNSVVELRSYPAGVTILIADNSSVIIDGPEEGGTMQLLTVVSGRVRVINTTSDQTVIIRAGRSLIEVRAGDINIDYAVYPWIEGRADRTLVVSTLEKSALVTIPAITAEQAALNNKKNDNKKTSLKKNKMLNKQFAMAEGETLYIDPILAIVERRPLYQGLESFWTRKGYGAGGAPANIYPAGFSPVLSEAQRPVLESKPYQPPAVAAPETPAPPAAEPKKKSKTGAKIAGIVAGTLLIGGGAAMQYVLPAAVPALAPDRNSQNTLFVAGFIPMGLGLITIIGSLVQ
jgi:F0F1-type ATP synthase membrane subunit c/vacuolar-type H+-ATPase subunit K